MKDDQIISYKGKRPKIGKNVYIAPGARLIGDVTIGDDSCVLYNAVLRADLAPIVIGKGSNIQDNVSVHLSNTQGVLIGDDVTVGHNAILHACTIEDDCTVGMGSIVMDGALIRKHSIVGAGALIPPLKEYPEASLLVGVPARIVRSLTMDEINTNHANTEHYVVVKDELMRSC
ncbi:MAG: gamma carbonic anhydrase family protein [Fibrobacteraceae bacterium]|nr:MAG: gamma carbonic anhydrase family protein [Fibrobacteres bacterium CG2_30_45_31]